MESAGELKNKVSATYTNQKGNLETQLESVMSNVSYKADDVISTLERKLHELKNKNKNLQKTTAEELKHDIKQEFNQTI